MTTRDVSAMVEEKRGLGSGCIMILETEK